MTAPQALVLGDANVDLVIRLPDRTSGALDLTGSVPQLFGGGSAANVAVALARLGVAVSYVGAVGDDGYGRWVRDDLAREGVDTRAVRAIRDAFTPMVLALIEPSGERLVLVPPSEVEHGRAQMQLATVQFKEACRRHGIRDATAAVDSSGLCVFTTFAWTLENIR